MDPGCVVAGWRISLRNSGVYFHQSNRLLWFSDVPYLAYLLIKLCQHPDQFFYLGTPFTGLLTAPIRHKTWAHPTAWDLHGYMFSWEFCLHSCVIFCYWRGHSRCKGHGFLLGGHHYWTLCKCVTTTVWSGRVTTSFLCILLHEVLCHFLVETPCPVSPPWLLALPKAAFQKPSHKPWSPTPLLNTTGGDCLSEWCWWQLNHV